MFKVQWWLEGTIVIRQSPEGGTRVLWGSSVRIEMGTLVTVPRVISMGASDARREIESVGLRTHQVGTSTNSFVSTQSPEGGKVVPKGNTVTIEMENPNL